MAKKHKDATSIRAQHGGQHADGLALAEPMALTTLKDLRKRAGQTQEELAAALGVGQDTISRLEKRSDMLLSTLRHYVECIGGQLALVATFPDQPPMVIDYRDEKHIEPKKRGRKPALDSP
ncbi:XRE family transcriptional regulator [Pusillimonas caeni]|uniref:helix-turn-helix domain-containing protein n=1 Tax=Pusillimonas caeni TaxID=1348472 RepID=UPI000E59A1AB|nr:helix-turn-helix transcriptional regulator [Pusillimonas caeni]TFL08769.1 XRE family transcriptional regulator [Pusillimonas caeni]